MEMIINQKAWDRLSEPLKKIVEASIAKSGLTLSTKNEAENARALQQIIDEGKVELVRFPDNVLSNLKKMNLQVLEEEAAKDEGFRKVLKSYQDFQKLYSSYEAVTNKAYDESRDIESK